MFIGMFLHILNEDFYIISESFSSFIIVVVIYDFGGLIIQYGSMTRYISGLTMRLMLFTFFKILGLLRLRKVFLLISLRRNVCIFSRIN